MPEERLQKLIAAAGLGSRRHAETLLRAGRVSVNGRTAQLGERADPERDAICLDGRPLGKAQPPLVVLLNKPAGVMCSCHDPEGRPIVLDLLPPELANGQGLHPVGRLDFHSRGALLLSNNGALTLRLTHPRYGHRKTYRVWVRGYPDGATLAAWRAGVPLDGTASQPVDLRVLQRDRQGTLLEIGLREGRNRQIRRTAALLGHPVQDLQRIAIGPLPLGSLPPGHWRELNPAELQALERQPPAQERRAQEPRAQEPAAPPSRSPRP